MFLRQEKISHVGKNGQMFTRTFLLLKCDNCGIEFSRRKVLRDVRREYHYHDAKCRYSSMNLGGKQDAVLRSSRKKKFGTEHHWQNEEIKKKRVLTWNLKFGVDNPAKSLDIIEKTKVTCNERYGTKFGFQSPKAQATCIRKYGTISASSTNYRSGQFDSKKAGIVGYRSSYERRAYELLDCDENVEVFYVETLYIHYEINGKLKKYYPDILVKFFDQTECLIEIKPIRKVNEPVNLAKRLAAIEYCRLSKIRYELWTEDKLFGGK